MSSDEDKKTAVQLVIEAFEHLAQAKSKPDSDPFAGKHLSVYAMGEWADGNLTESFLDEYVASNAKHVLECVRCQENITFFRTRRLKT